MTLTASELSPAPEVTLERAFVDPCDNAVATARTCYSPRVVHAEEVGRDEAARERRDVIARSIYQAGHHTTLQHATFQFVLERVSRHFIWSFLHSHPYYNSEQVSQRYVTVAAGNFTTPPLSDRGLPIYKAAIDRLMAAYQRLNQMLEPVVSAEYRTLFPSRSLEEKQWKGAIQKRCQEVSRYALPVATHAHLYHTISGLTLHRYHRLCRQMDVPEEQRIVVELMVGAVRKLDPDFLKVMEDPLPLEQTPEYQALDALGKRLTASADDRFFKTFDRSLGERSSKLVDYSANAEQTLADAVRTVLGLSSDELDDERAIAQALDSARNPFLSESLNLTAHGKLTRALFHPHFTFRKKISHTADSQDQRHRTTPGSRPLLARHFRPNHPDFVTPSLILEHLEAREYFEETMEDLWKAMRSLLELGEPVESVLYLLPNAFPIRFEESGDLAAFHHKWTKRLCYTAQEEIWRTSLEEVRQVRELFPILASHLGAPCALRRRAEKRPFCPEGDRYCGVPVWTKSLEDYRRVL